MIRLADVADFGPALYRRRLALGLTLVEVGIKAGMHLQQVHVALSGKQTPSLPTALKLANALIPREDTDA